MTTSRNELGNLPDYIVHLKESASTVDEGANQFRDALTEFGFEISNTMDAGREYRKEIPVLIMELCVEEFLLMEKDSDTINLLNEVRKPVLSQNGEIQDKDIDRESNQAFSQTKFLIGAHMKIVKEKVESMYNLCHYFANVAENCLKQSTSEHDAKILKLLSYDAKHLPADGVGFESILSVNNVGGIETWTLLRDIVLGLYLKKDEALVR